jgi:hypothetical protein
MRSTPFPTGSELATPRESVGELGMRNQKTTNFVERLI